MRSIFIVLTCDPAALRPQIDQRRTARAMRTSAHTPGLAFPKRFNRLDPERDSTVNDRWIGGFPG